MMRTILVFCAAALIAGCNPAPPPAAPIASNEPALAEQIAQARSGATDRIQLENHPVSDEDLAKLTDLPSLAVLLLDHDDNAITDVGLAHLSGLSNLIHLRIRAARITDDGIEHLLPLENLRILNLPRADLTGEGLAKLAQLKHLEQLRLTSPRLTDADLAVLRDFPAVKRIHLIDVPITDKGLKVFHDMPQLESLYIDGGSVSDRAYEALFHANPKIHVHVDQQHHDRDPQRHEH
jgi:hypothetical protein